MSATQDKDVMFYCCGSSNNSYYALQDAGGHHSSALFVQWVPYSLAGTTWEAEEEKYVSHLLDIVDTFAPGKPDPYVYTHPHAMMAHWPDGFF